ncbi:MAG: hypothetical protein ACJ8GN_24785 [Longimicrobiaceae bacterium]
MPRSSNPAIAVVDTLLIPLGAVCVVAGIVVATRYAEVRWLGVLMAVAGAVVLFGAVRALFSWGKAVRTDEATERAMVEAVQPGASVSRDGPVLAHWTYAPEEWHAYAGRELGFRTREALGMGAATLLLGTLIIGALEGEWRTAAIIPGVVAAFIALGRWLMAFAAYRRHRAAPAGDVIIGRTALLVNRRYDTIHDGNVRFGGARVLEKERPAILEITIMVPGKYRRTSEEYRIPIPAGREEEARAVARQLATEHA